MKETLLFLHGFPLNHTMWQHQLAAFGETFHCLAPDLRGFGANPPLTGDEPLTIDDFADDAAALLAQHGVSQATVCGLSMGGYVAFALWRKYPQLVRRLVLCNTKASADTPEARANRERQAARVRAEGARAIADEMLPRLVAPGNLARLEATLRAMIEANAPGSIVAALRALANRRDMRDQLSQIQAPTLVITGDADAISLLADAQVMAQGIPNARLMVIADAGHMSPLEQPTQFNAALQKFLSET